MLKNKGKRSNKKGFALLLVLASLILIFLFTQVVLGISAKNLNFVKLEQAKTKAQFAAESGVNRAIIYLSDNTTWDGTTNSSQTFKDTAMPDGESQYTVYVFNNLAGTDFVTASDGTKVPKGYCYVLSEGESISSSYTDTKKKVGALIKMSQGYNFEYAIMGDESVNIVGNPLVDAYNSDLGAYDTNTKIAQGADVATNSSDSGDFNLKGSSKVDGSVYGGTDGTGITQTGGATYTGTFQNLASEIPLPVVEAPSGLDSAALPDLKNSSVTLAPNKTYGAIKSSTSTITLKGGDYHFTGDFELTGQTQIIIDPSGGPVKIYVDGDITLTARSITQTGTNPLAENFQIYGTSTCETVKFTGNSDSNLVIYAPKADVTLTGSSDLTGAVVGKTVKSSGTGEIHYDVALKDLETPTTGSGVEELSRIRY